VLKRRLQERLMQDLAAFVSLGHTRLVQVYPFYGSGGVYHEYDSESARISLYNHACNRLAPG
jgi:hypothetical protein